MTIIIIVDTQRCATRLSTPPYSSRTIPQPRPFSVGYPRPSSHHPSNLTSIYIHPTFICFCHQHPPQAIRCSFILSTCPNISTLSDPLYSQILFPFQFYTHFFIHDYIHLCHQGIYTKESILTRIIGTCKCRMAGNSDCKGVELYQFHSRFICMRRPVCAVSVCAAAAEDDR